MTKSYKVTPATCCAPPDYKLNPGLFFKKKAGVKLVIWGCAASSGVTMPRQGKGSTKPRAGVAGAT